MGGADEVVAKARRSFEAGDLLLSAATGLHNGVLTYIKDSGKPVGLTLTVPAPALIALAQGDLEAARGHGLTASGGEGQLGSLFSVLQPGDPSFNIIEP